VKAIGSRTARHKERVRERRAGVISGGEKK
jgi:hypothetical protein